MRSLRAQPVAATLNAPAAIVHASPRFARPQRFDVGFADGVFWQLGTLVKRNCGGTVSKPRWHACEPWLQDR
jgi:hypothetical protein